MRDRLRAPAAAARRDDLSAAAAPAPTPAERGSLTVVGTGIELGTQLTPQARAAIEQADLLLYLAAEPATMTWLAQLNPRSRSLHEHYADGEDRLAVYGRIVDDVLDAVRGGADVCLAFYGHPGIFVTPSHEAVRRARAEGYPARMLPAVSAVDCLFADLGVDPASSGCLLYEASDFLARERVPDVDAALVLWQVGALGVTDVRAAPDPRAVDRLVAHLCRFYPPAHPAVVYEASPYPVAEPRIEWTTVAELPEVPLRPVSTLYIPPAGRSAAGAS